MATFSGTTANDTLIGATQSDYLSGLAGNDSLSGGSGGHDTLDGGTGSDTLDGGGGNDTYVVDSTKDVVHESGFDASDRIQASISIDLNSAAYDRIEHVTLTGTSGLSATGDAFANMLIGNSGANTLDGRGSADTMLGGAGNDTYDVDDANDAVIEFAGDGTDQVNSAVASYTLSDFVENLTLTGTADSGGTGNALANKITGNDGANGLSGADGNDTLTGNGGDDTLDGGPGADSLSGGKGNDTYEVDDIGDKIAESGGTTDVDTVDSAITYVLGSSLENLTLLGTASIDGTGNSLNNALLGNDKANTLTGLAGNDTLNGEGGRDLLMGSAGNDGIVGERDGDTLVGGSGNDIFLFGLTGSKSDVIADFNGLPGADLIDLSDLLPGSITAATAGQFLQTVSAGGSTTLRIDTDGGGNSFVDLAVLQGVTTDVAGLLANGDIHVFTSAPAATAVVGATGADTLAAGSTSELVEGLGGNDSLSGGSGLGFALGLGFDTLDGGAGSDTMAGGKGSDTYVVDSVKDVIIESGGADDRVVASISIDLRNAAYDGIEHVTLTGTNPLSATGDAIANMLIGNSAANRLDGGADADTMIGGAGNDIYTVDNSGDSVVELDGEGIDQVNSSASFILPDSVENLTLTGTADIDGTGNTLANTIAGNSGRNKLDGHGGNDTLTGNDGADTLDGGKGADSLTGGNGGDRYVVDDPGDKISETGASTDTDTVVASLSYTLGSTLENLVLDGTSAIDGTGNALANVITGNTAANVLSGLAGNDIINGGGSDFLFGGDGSDLLVGNGDVLVGGAGSDVFQLGGSTSARGILATIRDFDGLPGGDGIDLEFVLPSGLAANAADSLEVDAFNGSTFLSVNKTGDGNPLHYYSTAELFGVSTDLNGFLANAATFGAAATPPVVGTAAGDALVGADTSTLVQGLGGNDALTGGHGYDTLDGGTGADTLAGGFGGDTYIVDSALDVIQETNDFDRDDRIQASISIDLNNAAYANIEHVTLTGTAALNATGNSGDNLLIGNAGANILDGQGGVDQLAGGAGNDTYIVDRSDDFVIENPGEGTDLVIARTFDDPYALPDNVENLTLASGGQSEGSGNALANVITGTSGGDVLHGLDGNDTLIGNGGADALDGGAGADSMLGGSSDNSYFVDNVADKIGGETANGGNDIVTSSISYTLGSNLERLSLLTDTDGISGTGNSLDNFIGGGEGDNVLSGLAGNDTLEGNGGNDLLLGGDGNDTLEDFVAGAATLAGGAGSDSFIFGVNSLKGVDVIADFQNGPGGDVLDINDLLIAAHFDAKTSDINDFVQTVESNGSTTVRVDSNGGGDSFVDLVVLQGVNTDVAGLLNNGNLALPD